MKIKNNFIHSIYPLDKNIHTSYNQGLIFEKKMVIELV